jgi:hypothetical protein
MSFLMRVYEKDERQWKASIPQQPRNTERDQDYEVAGPETETTGEWCDDPNHAAYSPLAHPPCNVKQDQDLNLNERLAAPREWCDDADCTAYSPRAHHDLGT